MVEKLNILQSQFGMRVVRRRQELGLTQEALAVRLGIKAPSVATIEYGQRNLTLQTMCKVAEALETTVQELMFGTTVGK